MLLSVCLLASRNPWAQKIIANEQEWLLLSLMLITLSRSLPCSGEVIEWGQTQGDVLRIVLNSEKNRWPRSCL